MLDLCAHRLGACGVRCVRLQGGMTMGARDAAIDRFTRDPGVRIFLMSLQAGGEWSTEKAMLCCVCVCVCVITSVRDVRAFLVSLGGRRASGVCSLHQASPRHPTCPPPTTATTAAPCTQAWPST